MRVCYCYSQNKALDFMIGFLDGRNVHFGVRYSRTQLEPVYVSETSKTHYSQAISASVNQQSEYSRSSDYDVILYLIVIYEIAKDPESG